MSDRWGKLTRLVNADLALMKVELKADGLNTHIKMAKACPLKGTDIESLAEDMVSGCRSARPNIRLFMAEHQQTLSTRGNKFNHHKRWDYQYRKKMWKCPFCDEKPKKQEIVVVA